MLFWFQVMLLFCLKQSFFVLPSQLSNVYVYVVQQETRNQASRVTKLKEIGKCERGKSKAKTLQNDSSQNEDLKNILV